MTQGIGNQHTKRRSDWATPPWLFALFDREFRFTVDACAHAGNFKMPRYWSIEQDGLAQDWSKERVWCNPPYGATIGAWVRKAAESGGLAVLLVPCRTETGWWHEWALRANEMRFARGRVHFTLDGGGARRQRAGLAARVRVRRPDLRDGRAVACGALVLDAVGAAAPRHAAAGGPRMNLSPRSPTLFDLVGAEAQPEDAA